MHIQKKYSVVLILTMMGQFLSGASSTFPEVADADWLIVGAGAAGIATLGVLLDIGINPQRITWLDPEFNVGRMGAYYNNVPANSKTKEFVYFVNACKSFQECTCDAVIALHNYDPEERHNLSAIIEPLQCITNHLRTKVHALEGMMTGLYFNQGLWRISTETTTVTSHNVVLATGAHPRVLHYESQKIVPLDLALDKDTLRTLIKPDDVVGVIGSAHSAILLLKFLSEMPVKHIYNLYKTPIVYAPVKSLTDDWEVKGIAQGIKGIAAEWAKNVLEKNPPANLTRLFSSEEALKETLALCTKVIYAIGYDRNELPRINDQTQITHYNEKSGVIAPGLFGIGIAFPDKRSDENGNEAYCIGFDCFMEYAQQIVPYWVQNTHEQTKLVAEQVKLFKKMEELFIVYAL